MIIWLAGFENGMAPSETPPTPTTRILAIGTIAPGVDFAAVRAILPVEVRETAKLYLDSLGQIAGVLFVAPVYNRSAIYSRRGGQPGGRYSL